MTTLTYEDAQEKCSGNTNLYVPTSAAQNQVFRNGMLLKV